MRKLLKGSFLRVNNDRCSFVLESKYIYIETIIVNQIVIEGKLKIKVGILIHCRLGY